MAPSFQKPFLTAALAALILPGCGAEEPWPTTDRLRVGWQEELQLSALYPAEPCPDDVMARLLGDQYQGGALLEGADESAPDLLRTGDVFCYLAPEEAVPALEEEVTARLHELGWLLWRSEDTILTFERAQETLELMYVPVEPWDEADLPSPVILFLRGPCEESAPGCKDAAGS